MPDRTEYLRDAKLRRCYAAGAADERAGGAATDNPHDGNGTPEEAAWDQGITDAADGSSATYDMSLAGYPVAGAPPPENDAIT